MNSPEDNAPHVLIVDDQEGIRQLLVRILAHQGFSAVEAEDGRRAIELYRSNAPFAVAILDLTMPDVDGITLANELRALQPQLPIVLMSGFDMDNVLASRPTIDPAPSYLEKPFKIPQLFEAIKRAKDVVGQPSDA